MKKVIIVLSLLLTLRVNKKSSADERRCHCEPKKTLLLAITAVLAGAAVFLTHYYFNVHLGITENIFVYGSVLVLFAALSVICAGEFVRMLFPCGKVKYTVFAVIIDLAEVFPLPFCRQYFPMHSTFAGKSYFYTSWKYTAFIFIAILLLVAAFNFLKKRYAVNIKVRIERKISQ